MQDLVYVEIYHLLLQNVMENNQNTIKFLHTHKISHMVLARCLQEGHLASCRPHQLNARPIMEAGAILLRCKVGRD